MTASDADVVDRWRDAACVAVCLAVDRGGLGGVRLRAGPGPVRDAWLAMWRGLVDDEAPVRTIPLSIDDGRLLGGLDLAATLRAGRPVRQGGVLDEARGGCVVLAMAERIEASTAGRIAAAMDADQGARAFAVIALDEGEGEERLTSSLDGRLAFDLDLTTVRWRQVSSPSWTRDQIAAARERVGDVTVDDAIVEALCAAALALGIDSMRMPLFAVRAARTLAALAGRRAVVADDAAMAARLVLAPRARQLPAAAETAETAETPDRDPEPAPSPTEADGPSAEQADGETRAPDDDKTARDPATAELVLEAALAAMPPGLLSLLADGTRRQRRAARGGGAGAEGRGRARGTPAGVRRARPRPPERLSLIETLRAAAPWQAIRRAESGDDGLAPRVHVRAEDLHVRRFKERHPTTTVFVVDASGSAALHRLAEAKGTVELLLADCYVRRDSVAVLAFRGRQVDVLLPPTRSLVRAKRSLAGLPGGGGTPLAAALDATGTLVAQIRRRGETALAVVLTDGRANIARDGTGGRPQAEADALASARALRIAGVDAVLIDTSSQPHPRAAALADAMGALYRPLPHGDAAGMSTVIQHASRGAAPVRRRA